MWLRRIEVVTNIAVLAAAVSIIAVAVPRLKGKPAPQGPYAIGDEIAETRELKFGEPTVILNTASTCGYCTASMTFYQRLLATGVRTVAVTPEAVETNTKYLTTHGIRPAAVLSAAGNGLRFTGTPTMLFVDARGVVKGAWVGKQSPQSEEEILQAIR